MVRFVARQYRLDLPRIAVRFLKMSGRAGQIRREAGTWYVDLAETFIGDDGPLLSTLAHEMAHVVLLTGGVSLPDTDDNERLTDATAAMAGFASLMIRAHEIRKRVKGPWLVESEMIVRLGYLNPNELWHLALTRDRIRSGDSVRLFGSLSSRRRIRCWACDTRLSFSRARGNTTIGCPVCGMQQRVRIAEESDSAFGRFTRWLDSRRGLVEPLDASE